MKLKKPKQLQVSSFLQWSATAVCFLHTELKQRPLLLPRVQEVLDIARLLLLELLQHNDCEIEEKKSKLEQLKAVLEM